MFKISSQHKIGCELKVTKQNPILLPGGFGKFRKRQPMQAQIVQAGRWQKDLDKYSKTLDQEMKNFQRFKLKSVAFTYPKRQANHIVMKLQCDMFAGNY